MATKQLSDGGPDGTVMGQSATDLIGFHGAAASDQAAAITSVGTTAWTTAAGIAINSLIAALTEKGILSS